MSTAPASAASGNGSTGPGHGVNGCRAPGSPPHGRAENGSSGRVPVGRQTAPESQPRFDDAEAVAVIRELDVGAPGGRVSRLEIQKRLGCGGSKAARLADLARRR